MYKYLAHVHTNNHRNHVFNNQNCLACGLQANNAKILNLLVSPKCLYIVVHTLEEFVNHC